MVFSWKTTILNAKKTKIRRAHTMIITKGNPDFNITHVAAIKEYETHKTFGQIDKEVKEKFDKVQIAKEVRRIKIGGKS